MAIIFYEDRPRNIGDEFMHEGDGPFRVIRLLTYREARQEAKQLYDLAMARHRITEELFWYEVERVAETKRQPQTTARWHEVTALGAKHSLRMWSFPSSREIEHLLRLIDKQNTKLLRKLRRGSFYFLRSYQREAHLLTFLCSERVRPETRNEVDRLAKNNGGLEITPPLQDLVSIVVKQYEASSTNSPERVVIDRFLTH